jgi:hypothetical protein
MKTPKKSAPANYEPTADELAALRSLMRGVSAPIWKVKVQKSGNGHVSCICADCCAPGPDRFEVHDERYVARGFRCDPADCKKRKALPRGSGDLGRGSGPASDKPWLSDTILREDLAIVSNQGGFSTRSDGYSSGST